MLHDIKYVIILSLFVPLSTVAQERIEINFLDSTGLYKRSVKAKHFYYYRVKNVNRFVYTEVNGEVKSTNHNTDTPVLFSTIKLPSTITKFLPKKNYTPLSCSGDSIQDDIDALNDLPKLINDIDGLRQNASLNWDGVKAQKDAILTKYKIQGLETEMLFIVVHYNKVMDRLLTWVGSLDKATIDSSEVAALIAQISSIKKEGKLELLQEKFDQINESNYTYQSAPFDGNKDVHDITITAKASQPIRDDRPQNRTILIHAVTKGGLKIDFSTGVFANFKMGNPDFLGRKYYYNTLADSSREIRESSIRTKSLLSIGALMHVYWRKRNK